MKKILSVLLILAGMLAFTACGDDDDDNNTGESKYKTQLIGKWYVQAAKSDDDNEWIDFSEDDFWVEFQSNGTYRTKQYGDEEVYKGNWSIDDNTITVNVEGLTLYYSIQSVQGNEATARVREKGKSGYIDFKLEK